jgi:hypothetical protein
MRRILLSLLLLAFCFSPPAKAQDALVVTTCGTLPLAYKPGAIAHNVVDINGNTCISGSISSSTSGFAPGGNYANLTATNVSADVALPSGAVVAVQNTGTTTVSCNLTIGAGTAVANQNQIPASSTVYLTVGGNTHISCIDQTGSASNLVTLSGGTGLGTGFGGGGGSGGGGAVTMASGAVASGAYSAGSLAAGAGVDGWDLTQGAKTDAACAGDATSGCSVESRLIRIAQNLTTVNTSVQSVIAGVSQAQTGAAAATLVVKASAGSLVSVSGSAVSGSFIMIFNATSAPADGAVTPTKCWGPMAANGPFSFGWGPGPVLTMSTGIVVVSSSTGCFTKTATNANFIAAEFQ